MFVILMIVVGNIMLNGSEVASVHFHGFLPPNSDGGEEVIRNFIEILFNLYSNLLMLSRKTI